MANGPQLSSLPVVENISREDFIVNYRNPGRPVVIKNMCNDWPAINKWTPEFFKDIHGHRQVKVYDASFAAPGETYMSNLKTISLAEYIDHLLHEKTDLRMFLYNIISEAPELMNDLKLPTHLTNGLSKKFVFMFFGCEGSATPIHYDIDMGHVFHTVLYGKKRVALFSQKENDKLYRHPFTVRSYIDIDRPNFYKYPKLAEARGEEFILEAGDTIFIPAGYWHYFYYEKASYALSMRARHHNPVKMLEGYFNIVVMQAFDRLMNKTLGQKWFEWKERQAIDRAAGIPQRTI